MPNRFSHKFKKFVRRHSRRKARGARGRQMRKTRRRSTTRKHKLRNLAYGKRKTRPPSSLSIFPDKSPQLQKPGEPTKLNVFTTKNIALRDSQGREYNAIINDRLAYRRAPRGQNVQDFSDTLYGPAVTPITSSNYKKLKKGDVVYYDRGSVALRGPLIFKGHRRGPELLLEVKDAVYDKNYLFSIPVKQLNTEKLYRVVKKNKTRKKRVQKGGSTTPSTSTPMDTRSKIPRTRQGTPRFPWKTFIPRVVLRKKKPTLIVEDEDGDRYKELSSGDMLCRFILGEGRVLGKIGDIRKCKEGEQQLCREEAPRSMKNLPEMTPDSWWKSRQSDGDKIMDFTWDSESAGKVVTVPIITHDNDPDNFLVECLDVSKGEEMGDKRQSACKDPVCPDIRNKKGYLPERYKQLMDHTVNRLTERIVLDPSQMPRGPAWEMAARVAAKMTKAQKYELYNRMLDDDKEKKGESLLAPPTRKGLSPTPQSLPPSVSPAGTPSPLPSPRLPGYWGEEETKSRRTPRQWRQGRLEEETKS